MSNRRSGILEVKVNGVIYDVKGNWTYNLVQAKREALVGADGVHGYKELPQVPFVEGEITDSSNLDLSTLMKVDNATVTLSLANGKVVEFRDAWYAADGNVQTEEANVQIRFEALGAEEIRA
jgi:hypothetical protein